MLASVKGATAFLSRISVYRDGTQSVPTGTDTKIQFNAEIYDNNNEFDHETNYRFTPKQEGYYHIDAQVYMWMGVSSSKLCVIFIRKNGEDIAIDKEGNQEPQYASDNKDVYLNGVDDYIEIFVHHTQATNRNVESGEARTFLTIHQFA